MAIALQQKDFKVHVYESAPEIKPVGAGIFIASNGMQVFKKLGIQSKVEEAGNRVSVLKITDERLHPFSINNLSLFEREFKASNVALHRAALQEVLMDEFPSQNLSLNMHLQKIEQGRTCKLFFANGKVVDCGLVIGADGVHSTVRRQLFGPIRLRSAHQVCWRGIVEASYPWDPKEALEVWGRGSRFGCAKIDEKSIYWYALLNKREYEGKKKQLEDGSITLAQMFEGYDQGVMNLLKKTKKEDVIFDEIYDLKPLKSWYVNRACLLGDAAHATTPNLGQGACQAVEDAYVLSNLLSRKRGGAAFDDSVFDEFEKIRKPKALDVVKKSRFVGWLSQWENRILIHGRNFVLKYLPAFINKREMKKLFTINEFK